MVVLPFPASTNLVLKMFLVPNACAERVCTSHCLHIALLAFSCYQDLCSKAHRQRDIALNLEGVIGHKVLENCIITPRKN